MSRYYPDLNEYGLSSEDDEMLVEEDTLILSSSKSRNQADKSHAARTPAAAASPSGHSRAFSDRPRPLSKYDRRPRNVEFDGTKFVPSRRRSGSDMRREKQQQRGSATVLVEDSLSLLEFEVQSTPPVGDGRVKGRRAEVEGGLEGRGGGELWWLGRMEVWQVIALGCLMGLLLGIGYRGGLHLGFYSRDNLLKCPADVLGEPCLPPSQIRLAMLHVKPLLTQLHTKAGQFGCGVKNVHSKGITVEELWKALDRSSTDGDVVRNILVLILYNPHWNIVWLEPDGKLVKDWLRSPSPRDLLQSTSPALSIRCRVSIFLAQIWSKLKLIILVLVSMVMVVGVVRWYMRKRKMAERNKFMMVDRILSMLRRHYETMKRKKNLIPYLAIIHVRDMLITPSERDRKQESWEEACAWIAKYESRVRVERQRIAGEDFDVWKWIQEDPPPTEDTILLGEGDKAGPSSVVSAARRKNWYNGTTFEDHTGRNAARNSPYGSPSPCIRLKNMFEAVKHMKDDQSKEIEDSVLDRCVIHGGVIHIYVDRRSPFGCVYLKMVNVESAVKAYKALHGGWYKGKLVTGKYIPPEKYHKWFAAASTAKDHIYPAS